MTGTWRVVGAALGSFTIVGLMAIGVFTALVPVHCDNEQKVLATQSGGRTVISCLEACTGFGTTLNQTIELTSASGERKTLLQYEPTGGIVGCNGKMFSSSQEPEVDWSDAREIRVFISVVYKIAESHDALDGVHVTYTIGTVISRDCEPAKAAATRT